MGLRFVELVPPREVDAFSAASFFPAGVRGGKAVVAAVNVCREPNALIEAPSGAGGFAGVSAGWPQLRGDFLRGGLRFFSLNPGIRKSFHLFRIATTDPGKELAFGVRTMVEKNGEATPRNGRCQPFAPCTKLKGSPRRAKNEKQQARAGVKRTMLPMLKVLGKGLG